MMVPTFRSNYGRCLRKLDTARAQGKGLAGFKTTRGGYMMYQPGRCPYRPQIARSDRENGKRGQVLQMTHEGTGRSVVAVDA